MYRRKLIALGYHHPEAFSPHDEDQFRNLVIWLEGRKIRFYKIDDRYLLNEPSDSDWNDVFAAYLRDLECPFESDDRRKVTEWLLGYAIRQEYDVEANIRHQEREERKNAASKLHEHLPAGTLGAITGDDPDLKSGIDSLSRLLGVPQHPDHITTLQAVRTLIEGRLSADHIETLDSSRHLTSGKGGDFQTLDDVDLGFSITDPAVNEAAKIVRLLHLHELRDLQSQINRAIVLAQKSTADPKTDQALGQVGR